MKNVNIDKIKNTPKMKLQKVAISLAIVGMLGSAATPMASAASSISFDRVVITDYNVKGTDYTVNNLSTSQVNKFKNLMGEIDKSFESLYTIMANNGMSINYAMTKEQSMSLLLAHFNEISNMYEAKIKALDYNVKRVAEDYLNSRINQAKAVYSNMLFVSLKELDEYSKQFNCVFANSVGNSNVTTVAIYEHRGSQVQGLYTYNQVADNNRLVIIPVSDEKGNVSYTGSIVNKANYANSQAIIAEADGLFDNIEKALSKGNYTRNLSERFNMDDVYVAIYGDTNLVVNSISQKYADKGEALNVAKQYMTARQKALVAKACDKNNGNYSDFVYYANRNAIRKSEENGYVYYDLANGLSNLYTTVDRGYIDTKDIKASGVTVVNPSATTLNKVTYQVKTGVNIYFNNQPFFPMDVNGNSVPDFICNGTTYAPVRAISNMYNKSVRWDALSSSVFITDNPNDSYVVDYGHGIINSSLTNQTITVQEGIRIYYNGNLIQPTDVNGRPVPGILWNGTTYLPVRALANAFGSEVDYDAKTNSVYLGSRQNINKPVNPSTPSIPNVSVSDAYMQVYNNNGVLINLYVETGTEYYYTIQNGNKVYVTSSDSYYLDSARTMEMVLDGHIKGKTR